MEAIYLFCECWLAGVVVGVVVVAAVVFVLILNTLKQVTSICVWVIIV